MKHENNRRSKMFSVQDTGITVFRVGRAKNLLYYHDFVEGNS